MIDDNRAVIRPTSEGTPTPNGGGGRPPVENPRDKPWQVRVDKDENVALTALCIKLGTPGHPTTAGAAFRWLLNGYRTGKLIEVGAPNPWRQGPSE